MTFPSLSSWLSATSTACGGAASAWRRHRMRVGVRDADYDDAIQIAALVAPAIGYQLKGGILNVARRDGIGTLLLDAVVTIGRMPDHCLQGVGGELVRSACGLWRSD